MMQENVVFADPKTIFSGTVLVVAPHMDDEVLACGGTIARLPNKERVFLAYATDGAQAYTPVVPWRDTTSPELSAVRAAEARAALLALGVAEQNIYFLNFPDGRLKRHLSLFSQSLVELVRAIRPDHMLVPFRYDRHPDHLAVNRAATAALRRGDYRAELFEYFVYYRWRLLRRRDVRAYVRTDQLVTVGIEDVAAQKRRALDCFKSQTTQFYQWQDRPILSRASLDEVCRTPEFFLRYDPALSGTAVFTGARNWIRLVHQAEPFIKKRKDQALALVRRGMHWNVSSAS
jgi:LmbE family N-acetylglucosaminyl deacetylase